MKMAVVTIAMLMSLVAGALGAGEPMEYKVAVIDAGLYLPQTDSSVDRARRLLVAVSKIYGITPERAADMAAKVKQIAQKEGIGISVLDLFDWSLVACERTCTDRDLADFLAMYATARSKAGQTHHQTMRGLLLITQAAKGMK